MLMKNDVIGVDKASTDPSVQRAPFVRRGPQTYRILKVLWFFRTGLRSCERSHDAGSLDI